VILSIDPGLRGIGAALFDPKGPLLYCGYIKNPITEGAGPQAWFSLGDHAYEVLKAVARKLNKPIDVFITELMVVYKKNTRGDPNDLIQVTGVSAAVGAALPIKKAFAYPARVWKGQVPKQIHNARVIGSLTADERALLEACGCPKALLHNVIDAVGLGLYHLEITGIRVGRAA